jgi:hypothetical protein
VNKLTLNMITALALVAVSGCARYQEHNGEEPYGYFSSASDEGYLQVGYESWRPGSRQRICGYARRRIEELSLENVKVLNEKWEQFHEHTHVREQAAYVYGANGRDVATAVELSPAYVSARVIRRCLLTLEQPAG